MDCLKVLTLPTTPMSTFIGVFHSSLEQKTQGYNALYLSEKLKTYDDANWTKVVKLSERGSQGYLYRVKQTGGLLVLYELENH